MKTSRHTVRHKQRRVANLLQQLQSDSPMALQVKDDLRLNSKRKFGFGGEPMSCISSSPLFSMKWIQPFITSNKCCSMPCPNYGDGSHHHFTGTIPMSKFPRHRSAPLDLGLVPTEMAIPPSQRTSPGGPPAISANSCLSCTSAQSKPCAIS